MAVTGVGLVAGQAMRTDGLMMDRVYPARAISRARRVAAAEPGMSWPAGGQLAVVAAEAGR